MGRGHGTQTIDFADIERAGLRDIELDGATLATSDRLWVFTALATPMGDNEAADIVQCFKKRRAKAAWPRMQGISVVSLWEFEIFYRAASQEEAEQQILDKLIEMDMIEMIDSWHLHEQGS